MDREQFNQEIEVLLYCQSPFLVQYCGAYLKNQAACIIMEFMDLGNLRGIVNLIKFSRPSEDLILSMAWPVISKQILQGLNYLHNVKQLVHKDIKPENILINSNGEVKICDFGICMRLTKNAGNQRTEISSGIGTCKYYSPESILYSTVTYVSDIWSFGNVLYELATGEHPYDRIVTPQDYMEALLNEPEPMLPTNAGFSIEFQDFVACCLKKDPDQR